MRSVQYLQRNPWPAISIVMVGLLVFAYSMRSTPNVTRVQIQQEEVAEDISRNEIRKDQQLITSANLEEFHNAQQFFYIDYEYYTTDLLGLGWAPMSSVMNYKLGFLSPSIPLDGDVDTTMMTSDVYLSEVDPFTERNFSYMTDAARLNLNQYASLCRQGCTANEEGFELMIAIPVDALGNADVWLYNHHRELVQVWNGMSNQWP